MDRAVSTPVGPGIRPTVSDRSISPATPASAASPRRPALRGGAARGQARVGVRARPGVGPAARAVGQQANPVRDAVTDVGAQHVVVAPGTDLAVPGGDGDDLLRLLDRDHGDLAQADVL